MRKIDIEVPTGAVLLTQLYRPMTADMRPQDPNMDGRGMKFETLEHGGKYPDMMPQAIRVTDADGRSCIYVPVEINGEAVDSISFGLHSGESTHA